MRMRLLLPPPGLRRDVDTLLATFFRTADDAHFESAMRLLCQFYKCRRPRIVWWQRLPNPNLAGETYENGTIHLVHPDDWRRNRKYKTSERWRRVVYHEFYHFYSWAENEPKANLYEHRFVRGMRRRTRLTRYTG